MPRPSRFRLACHAFASGACALVWIQIWLRLGTLVAMDASDRLTLVAVLVGISIGVRGGARVEGNRRGVGGLQLALALVAGAITPGLPLVGSAAPLLLVLAGTLLGAVVGALWTHPSALWLGGAAGLVLGGLAAAVGLGLAATNGIAILVALVNGLGALSFPASASREPRGAAREGLPRSVLLAAGALLGAYLVFAARALAPYTGDSVYARTTFGTMLLLGLGIGAAAKPRRRWSGPLLLAAAAGVLASAGAYGQLEWVAPGAARRLGGIASWPRVLGLVSAETAVLVWPVTIPLGALLGRTAPIGGAAFGAAAATLAVPWLVVRFGSLRMLVACLVVNLVLALALSFQVRRFVPRALAATACVVLVVAALGLGMRATPHWPFVERYGPLLLHRETPSGVVLVTDDPEQGRILRFGDGRSPGGVGTDPEDRVDAQIPMLLHPSVRRVLELDFGVGNGASSILAHSVERLDAVDPTGAAAEIAPLFEDSNLDVLSDERLVLRTTNPWRFLAETDETWDVIGLPVERLENAGAADLPTRERLALAKRRLAPGGIVSLRLNVGRASLDEIRTVLRTMLDTFRHVSIWDGPLKYRWVLAGSDVPYPPDPARPGRLREDPDVDAELASLGLDDPNGFLAHFVRADGGARELAGDGAIITTDRVVVDESSARSPDTFFGLGNAAADTALADLTAADGRENVGLSRLFEKLHQTRALKQPVTRSRGGAPG